MRQVLNQCVGVAVTAAYSFGVTWLIATALKKTVGLRVTAEQEAEGLDVSLHGEQGYALADAAAAARWTPAEPAREVG